MLTIPSNPINPASDVIHVDKRAPGIRMQPGDFDFEVEKSGKENSPVRRGSSSVIGITYADAQVGGGACGDQDARAVIGINRVATGGGVGVQRSFSKSKASIKTLNSVFPC